jgi:thymidylate synthase
VDSGFNYDIPYENEGERRTSPCLRGIDFKIKNNYLIMSVIFRSWDLYAGFPENMGGLTLLNEYVCDQLQDVNPGPMAFTSAGLHAYDYQIEPIMSILRK